jgi:hypothetical protein
VSGLTGAQIAADMHAGRSVIIYSASRTDLGDRRGRQGFTHADEASRTCPTSLVITSYFSVRDNKIVSLTVIFNQPSPY